MVKDLGRGAFWKRVHSTHHFTLLLTLHMTAQRNSGVSFSDWSGMLPLSIAAGRFVKENTRPPTYAFSNPYVLQASEELYMEVAIALQTSSKAVVQKSCSPLFCMNEVLRLMQEGAQVRKKH